MLISICLIISIIIFIFILTKFNQPLQKSQFTEYLDVVHENPTSPLSGYEFEYDPDKWNDNGITDAHNCYDYAFNNIDHKQKIKTQPGELSNYKDKKQIFKCDFIEPRLLKDHKDNLYISNFYDKCKPYHYKIALLMDENDDYHFMRQDKNGLWSHKPGPNNITNKDSDNNLISNPAESNNKISSYNYDKVCNYYCVHNTAEQKFKNNDKQ